MIYGDISTFDIDSTPNIINGIDGSIECVINCMNKEACASNIYIVIAQQQSQYVKSI